MQKIIDKRHEKVYYITIELSKGQEKKGGLKQNSKGGEWMTFRDWQKMSKEEKELYYKAYIKGFKDATKKRSYLRQQIAD